MLAVLADNDELLREENAVCRIQQDDTNRTTLASGDQGLRCLGAALIMQWNTLPVKLQRELFDHAGGMGELLDTSALRGQIARFLHSQNRGRDGAGKPLFVEKITRARAGPIISASVS